MARARREYAETSSEIDLTPMLDVVFILLIFFIVTSTFARGEAIGLARPPPPSGSSEGSTLWSQVSPCSSS